MLNFSWNINDAKHETKGNLTELQCILAFYELGYKFQFLMVKNSRYDFIADIEGKLLRIQCKTCHLVGENQEAIEFKTASTRINSQILEMIIMVKLIFLQLIGMENAI